MSEQTVRVLLVEDNDHDAEIVQRMLAKYPNLTFELDRACTTTECLQKVDAADFDLVVLDYSLPGEDGVAFLQRIRGREDMPPVIMLTGWGDGRVAAEAMQSGACDYFPKNSINSDMLAHAIHNAIAKYRSGNEEKRMRDQLEQLVITDDLTGVFNRRFLAQSLDKECARARRYRRDISCLMIDLDDFKKCNDVHGHLVGDLALKQVAAVIGESVRDPDEVVRYGGEEFVVIMPETPRHAAVLAAERIRSTLSGRPLIVNQQPVRITVSIGVCTPGQDHDIEPEVILACADDALRDAKITGKNRVCGRHQPPILVSGDHSLV